MKNFKKIIFFLSVKNIKNTSIKGTINVLFNFTLYYFIKYVKFI